MSTTGHSRHLPSLVTGAMHDLSHTRGDPFPLEGVDPPCGGNPPGKGRKVAPNASGSGQPARKKPFAYGRDAWSPGAGGGQPPGRKPRRRLEVAGTLLILVIAVVGTALVPAASAGAADDPYDQTDWTYHDDMVLDGPVKWWNPCGKPSAGGDCYWTYASGGDPEPTNCAQVPTGAKVGAQEVYAMVPEGATATVPYRVEYTVANTGEHRTHRFWLDQSAASGYVKLGVLPFADTPSMSVEVCDNEAEQHHERDGKTASRMAVASIAMRCIEYCDAPPPQPPAGLAHAPFGYLVTEVFWDEADDPTRAGFLISYHRDEMIGDPALADLEPWSSAEYRTYSPRHLSPELAFGQWYRVEVRTVDVFGRVSDPAVRWFEQKAPPLSTDPAESDTDTWLDDLRGAAEAARTFLDVVGIFDPTPISDSLSSIVSVGLGDFDEAGISAFAAVVPYAGDTAKTAKVAKYSAAAADAAKKTSRATKKVDYDSLDISDQARRALKKADEASGFVRYTNKRYYPKGVGGPVVDTDDIGRVARIEVADLWKLSGEPRPRRPGLAKNIRGLGELADADDAGHALGRQFIELEEVWNYFPQLSQQNQGAYRRVENHLKRLMQRHQDEVGAEISFTFPYNSHSFRPLEIQVRPTIGLNEQPVIRINNTAVEAATLPD